MLLLLLLLLLQRSAQEKGQLRVLEISGIHCIFECIFTSMVAQYKWIGCMNTMS